MQECILSKAMHQGRQIFEYIRNEKGCAIAYSGLTERSLDSIVCVLLLPLHSVNVCLEIMEMQLEGANCKEDEFEI